MKRISINMYNKSMGTLIDIQDPESFMEYHHPDAINIYADRLLYNHKKFLEKNKPYFIVCRKGNKSRKVANLLEFYGYDVTQVSYDVDWRVFFKKKYYNNIVIWYGNI